MKNTKTNTEKTIAEILMAVSMGRELLATTQDTNNVLTVATAPAIFQGHYFNLESEQHGVIALITEILTERQAIFPKGIEHSEYRKIAITTAMTASEIITEVQNRFSAGSARYPYETIHHNLTNVMAKRGMIAKIKLTNKEDKPRLSKKPRVRWYLIQAKAN